MAPPTLFPTEPSADAAETLEGTVERIVFQNPESGWTVLRLKVAGLGEPAGAVGLLAGVEVGETLRLTGAWEADRRYGRQFRAAGFVHVTPRTLAGLRRYLGSGRIPGIGKAMAQRLVRAFGLATLDVIDREPQRLAEVPGIGAVRSRKVREAFRERRALREAMIFLYGHGIPTGQATRIWRRYGDSTVGRIRADPYALATEVPGIGFLTADRFAASLGVPPDSPLRAAAGLLFALERASEEGHVYLPRAELLARGQSLLAIPAQRLSAALEALGHEHRVETRPGPGGEPALYLPALASAEERLATALRRLLGVPPRPGGEALEAALARFEEREAICLAPHQREAVRQALGAPLLVITGGPGTGKTTLVRAVVRILAARAERSLLAAPTGRAAKRLAEATGSDARTVHRLLEFDPLSRAFRRDRERPLEADALIVDEASMLDLPLAASLLDALPPRARLILVGDADQLPSVGPGRVLDDLVRSERVPVVRLNRIFRQAAASRIVRTAHRIRDGELPDLDAGEAGGDFFFVSREDPEAALATVKELVTRRIPRRFGLDPRRDIQVLSPMRRGLLGIDHLNAELQALLNPNGAPVPGAGGLRVGDRVMQMRNDYDLEVFNGDVGRIVEGAGEAQRVEVEMDDERIVAYERAALDELALAYACSIHKAQGSEYPCVVLPLHTQHRILLERNLLYTAVTRARRLLVLVGSRRAVALAVRTARRHERHSGLAARLTAERP